MRKLISKDDMRDWFLERYADPADTLPYESAEGGYLYISGDPVDPGDALHNQFTGKASDQRIDELAKELEEEFPDQEWVPVIEPEDDIENDEVPDERLDSSNINVELRNPTISNVIDRFENNEIHLSPPYQRKPNLWKPRQQSALIESILLKFPLPSFYFDVLEDGTWLVVDGLQRLSAIKNFILGQLKLSELEFLKELEGLGYTDLKREHQRRINETQLTAFFIQAGTPSAVKYNLFKRLNTGGLTLTQPEIRHAIFQGRASQFVSSLARLPEFRHATVKGVPTERMQDEDFVTRFLAFYIRDYSSYTKGMERFLTDTLEMLQRGDVTETDLNDIQLAFTKALSTVFSIFGKNAFRKMGSVRRGPVNKALFEIWTVNLAKLMDSERAVLETQRSIVKDRFATLLHTSAFDNAISHNTAHADAVRTRFSQLEKLLRGILNGGDND
jgi:hypothetical protein